MTCTKAAHTPGPWRVGFSDGSGETYITAGDHEVVKDLSNVITVVGGCEDSWGIKQGVTNPADAYLIAAAPEMLEALEGLWPFIHEEGMENSELSPFKVAWLKAEAAIRKARGTQ